MKENKYIWYASYGSNILEERFHCYIRGGMPKGSSTIYNGCKDKTLPIDNEDFYIPYELYFAKKSIKTWNGGGVAFIANTLSNERTLGRLYLITMEQFIDVLKQECSIKQEIKIAFDSIISHGSYVIKETNWYNKIIYLGNQSGKPIFTFTHDGDYFDEINKPNDNYLKTIMEGIKEITNFNEHDLAFYFSNLKGITGAYSTEELIALANK
ncbi:hypothetical protein ACI6PS_05805 [Flavobacterium sp. PLA-1-15]|uniref:hypothetical protein n=1 Tax=Flavobacterium sp. PLA-1-15 TaxID=3380533 RepID=UPI003B817A75